MKLAIDYQLRNTVQPNRCRIFTEELLRCLFLRNEY